VEGARNSGNVHLEESGGFFPSRREAERLRTESRVVWLSYSSTDELQFFAERKSEDG